jgi:hypothetical protein
MIARFSIAAIFAVLVAASRPAVTGGDHDLLAVGVRTEETVGGKVVARTVIAAPTDEAIAAYRAILHTGARAALLQGTTVFGPTPADRAQDPQRVVELVFYGVRSRAGRAPIAFGEIAEKPDPALAGAHAAARSLAALPPTVTEAGARLLLQSDDDAAFRDGLEALAAAKADAASGAARAAALAEGASSARRVYAIQVLERLGGSRAYQAEWVRLRASADPLVREAAK